MALNFDFVMSNRITGQYLYVHEHKQFYTFAATKKRGKKTGKMYRCIKYTNGCKARVLVTSENECMLSDDWQPHAHNDSCEERYNQLKALEAVKVGASSVRNVASGSRKRPKEVFNSATAKLVLICFYFLADF